MQYDWESASYRVELSIPNTEVGLAYNGFLDKWLKSSNFPDLSGLNKVKGVFNAIINKDQKALSSALTNGDKIEFSDAWSFNFLHIAALSGNKRIFDAVSSHPHYVPLLNSRGLEDLRAIDFALLGGANLTDFPALKGDQTVLQQPGYTENFVCFPVRNVFVPTGAVGIFAKKVYGILHGAPGSQPNWIGNLVDFGIITGLGVTANWVAKTVLASQCQNYDAYHSVDVSQPASLDSLIQFEKYIIENPGAYVSLNGSCKGNCERVAELREPVIDIKYAPVKELSFVLCSPIKEKRTHTPNDTADL